MQTSAPTTPSERRRFQQREEARRRILDATEMLLVEAGYERFSMRRLADRCGYTAPTIYHHFGDKRGLLDAVLEERLQLVLERVRHVRRHDDPAETVQAMLAEFARFGIENPTHYRMINIPRPAGSPPPQSSEKIRALLEELLGELAAAGRLRSETVEEAVQFVWVLVHGLVSLRNDRPDYEWSETLLEFSLDKALRGLVLPAGENRRSRGSS